MKLSDFRLVLACLLIAMVCACEKDAIQEDTDNITAGPQGTLRVIFRISHPWLPLDKIVPTELHVAKDGVEIYKGNYLQSANVTDFQDEYFFYLEPGSYYYEAAIGCICEGDSCSAGGFPGYQYATKHTMDKFIIYDDEITTVIPTFQ